MNDYELYSAYETVRRGGKYNMITECVQAAEEAGLTMDQYKYVINHYTKLNEEYQAKYIVDKALEEEAPF